MGMLIEGEWVDRTWSTDEDGHFDRQETTFRDWITRDASSPYAPEAGRYHLYVSYACPWAHRTLITRRLKGLKDAISVSVVDPLMGDGGWKFSDAPGATADQVNGTEYLREVYQKADSEFTGRVTVPVLWDKERGTIVNNESIEIVEMFDMAFDDLAGRDIELFPEDIRGEVDEVVEAIYQPINNGVYRCGFAGTQSAYEEAVSGLFDALDHWNDVLGERRYLCGDRLTVADICMFTTLYRFDEVYHTHFKCNVRRIADYENLWPYARDVYQQPGVAESCNMLHIKEHYYRSHETVNPKRLVPRGPNFDWDAPHGRG